MQRTPFGEAKMASVSVRPELPERLANGHSSDSVTTRDSEPQSPLSLRAHSNSTPTTDLSSIEVLKAARVEIGNANARLKASSLSLIEQVCCRTMAFVFPFILTIEGLINQRS